MNNGFVVLYHFDPPYKHARHCFDFAVDVDERIKRHYARKSRGPKLVHAALDNGSTLRVGRIRTGTLIDLFTVRRSGNATRLCKICKQRERIQRQDGNLLELLRKSIELRERERKTCSKD